jgi:putative glutamine amidotransferase
VLLVTHPRVRELKALRALLRHRVLAAPELYVLGVYHRDERRPYRAARAFVQRAGGESLGLLELDCPLDPARIFANNGCSATFAQLVERSVGAVFTGGPDLPPQLYGEPTQLGTNVRAPGRQRWEVSLLFHLVGGARDPRFLPLLARRPDYPVLAICLGLQELNVAAGGTLVQDILAQRYGVRFFEDALALPADQQHRNAHRMIHPGPRVSVYAMHPIRLEGAADVWGPVVRPGGWPHVASAHHQAIKALGPGLQVVATSLDRKVVEAVRHTRFRRVLGVQFHPEARALWDPGVPARRHARHPVDNVLARALAERPRSLAFHRDLWRAFGDWLAAQSPR